MGNHSISLDLHGALRSMSSRFQQESAVVTQPLEPKCFAALVQVFVLRAMDITGMQRQVQAHGCSAASTLRTH